jgi:DNA replication and repair protein RecF
MINSIRLQNFRSYGDSAFEFEPTTNIVVGPNASGKTNLLDAVYFSALGHPVRKLDDSYIKHGKDWARIDAVTGDNQKRTIKITKENARIQKKFEIDDLIKSRLPADQMLPAVLFEPNQLYRLTMSPEVRRTFIDDLCSLIHPEAAKQNRDYQRTLLQRNRLLKQSRNSTRQDIFAWNVKICELGEQVAGSRQDVIARLNSTLSKYYSSISGNNEKMQLTYESKQNTENYASSMLAKLEKDIDIDVARGFTGIGPHRDDIAIAVNNEVVKNFASRGETRTLVLALKKCETKLIEEATNKKPILLFDDVFSELDGKRRKLLTGFISDYQSIITTTDADIIDKTYAQKTNLIKLK